MRIYKPSVAVSAKNLPAHTKLKFRQDGQSSSEDVRAKDLRAELEEKERKHFGKRSGGTFDGAISWESAQGCASTTCESLQLKLSLTQRSDKETCSCLRLHHPTGRHGN
jgi:hypothetical protein